jgi:hypothetical protein
MVVMRVRSVYVFHLQHYMTFSYFGVKLMCERTILLPYRTS